MKESKKLNLKEVYQRNILILIGNGKSTLSNFIVMYGQDYDNDVYIGIASVQKNADTIKQHFAGVGIKTIIHLESDVKIPLWLKRRALIFKIEPIV